MGVSSSMHRSYGFVVQLGDAENIEKYMKTHSDAVDPEDEDDFDFFVEEFLELLDSKRHPLSYSYCGETQYSETVIVGIGSEYLTDQYEPILAEKATKFPEISDKERELVQEMYDARGYELDENGERAIGWYFIVNTG